MKYIAIDVETTGLDATRNRQILEIGMILEDTEKTLDLQDLPQVQFLFEISSKTKWDDFAWQLHGELRRDIEHSRNLFSEGQALGLVKQWVYGHGIQRPIFAGKNIGIFDLPFIATRTGHHGIRVPNLFKCYHRMLDPTVAFALQF